MFNKLLIVLCLVIGAICSTSADWHGFEKLTCDQVTGGSFSDCTNCCDAMGENFIVNLTAWTSGKCACQEVPKDGWFKGN